MERLLPHRSDRASDKAPPVVGLRPFLLVLPSKGRGLDLQLALQESGVPCLLALDEKMVEYWRRTEDTQIILIELGTGWTRRVSENLIRQGRTVVALTDDEEERIRAVSLGFEDSFPLTVLAKETAVKLRSRYFGRGSTAGSSPPNDGPLRIDTALRRAWWREVEVHLSAMQFDLLAYLAARPEQWVSIDTLRREIWREAWGDDNKVAKMIGRIREALGADARAFIPSSRGFYCYKPR